MAIGNSPKGMLSWLQHARGVEKGNADARLQMQTFGGPVNMCGAKTNSSNIISSILFCFFSRLAFALNFLRGMAMAEVWTKWPSKKTNRNDQ